jgi:hypothetical protein
MELLESVGPRPRQARYQAALRPDMNCATDSKALSNFAASPIRGVCLCCAKTVPNTFTGPSLWKNAVVLQTLTERKEWKLLGVLPKPDPGLAASHKSIASRVEGALGCAS